MERTPPTNTALTDTHPKGPRPPNLDPGPHPHQSHQDHRPDPPDERTGRSRDIKVEKPFSITNSTNIKFSKDGTIILLNGDTRQASYTPQEYEKVERDFTSEDEVNRLEYSIKNTALAIIWKGTIKKLREKLRLDKE
jgi:hypothetical protein